MFLNSNQLLEIFGFFLMILIGLELLETIKYSLKELLDNQGGTHKK